MKKKFLVEGMTCASCQAHVERAVRKLPGVKECRVSLLTNSMEVEWEEGTIQEEDILLAVSRGNMCPFPVMPREGRKGAGISPQNLFQNLRNAVLTRNSENLSPALSSFFS